MTDKELLEASPGWQGYPGEIPPQDLMEPDPIGKLGDLRVVVLAACYWQYLVRFALVFEVGGKRYLAPIAELPGGPQTHHGLTVLDPRTQTTVDLTAHVMPHVAEPWTLAILDLYARFVEGMPREGLAVVTTPTLPAIDWPGGLARYDVEQVASSYARWKRHGTMGGWYSERSALRLRADASTFTFERVPYEEDGDDGIALS